MTARPTRGRALACALVAAATLTACSGGGRPVAEATRPAVCDATPGPLRSIDPALVHINIYNGGGPSGEAKKVAKALTHRGFAVITTANDPRRKRPTAPVEIRYGAPGRTMARTLATHIDGALLTNDGRYDPTVDLVIGKNYTGLVALQPAKAGTFTVNVFNTTSTPGLAQEVADELTSRGFTVGGTGNDPLGSWWPDSPGAVRYGTEGEPAARTVAANLPGVTMVKDDRKDTSVDLLLGARFTDLASRAKATPKPVPSATTAAPAECVTASGAATGSPSPTR